VGDTHITGRHFGGDTHITSDMCAGIHISRGYTYHCDTVTETKHVMLLFLVRRNYKSRKFIINDKLLLLLFHIHSVDCLWFHLQWCLCLMFGSISSISVCHSRWNYQKRTFCFCLSF